MEYEQLRRTVDLCALVVVDHDPAAVGELDDALEVELRVIAIADDRPQIERDLGVIESLPSGTLNVRIRETP